MQITHLLSQEHQVVLEQLQALEAALDRFDPGQVAATLRFFDEQVTLHRRKEEEVLFPALARYIGTEMGPIAVMLHEHREEQARLEEIRVALDAGDTPEARGTLRRAGRQILDLLRNHIAKEDNVLFPLAERTLSAEEKMEAQEGMDAIGYCVPTPPPVEATAQG